MNRAALPCTGRVLEWTRIGEDSDRSGLGSEWTRIAVDWDRSACPRCRTRANPSPLPPAAASASRRRPSIQRRSRDETRRPWGRTLTRGQRQAYWAARPSCGPGCWGFRGSGSRLGREPNREVPVGNGGRVGVRPRPTRRGRLRRRAGEPGRRRRCVCAAAAPRTRRLDGGAGWLSEAGGRRSVAAAGDRAARSFGPRPAGPAGREVDERNLRESRGGKASLFLFYVFLYGSRCRGCGGRIGGVVVRRRRAAALATSRGGWPGPRRGRDTVASAEAALAARGDGVASPIRLSLLISCLSLSLPNVPSFALIPSLSVALLYSTKKGPIGFWDYYSRQGVLALVASTSFGCDHCSLGYPDNCLLRWGTEQKLHA